jgi:ATP-dependent helicase HrpB
MGRRLGVEARAQPWSLRARLDAEAPTHLEVPTGSRIPVDYAAEGGPAPRSRARSPAGRG